VRKLQYISELERSVTSLQVRAACVQNSASPKKPELNYALRKHSELNFGRTNMPVYEFGLNFARTNKFLQTEVSALSPRVAFLDHQRSLLTLGNSHLKQRIAALAQDKIFKDGDRHCRPHSPDYDPLQSPSQFNSR